jgi:hypothetical protein
MKLLHILLSVLGFGTLTACKKAGYEKKNDAVYFKDYWMQSADYATFDALNDVFAKDNNQGYYRGIAITGSDGTHFVALDDYYARDNTSVFYCDNYLDFKLFETTRKDKITRVANADAGSFVAIANADVYKYAKDKLRCYYQGAGFAVKDIASFEPLMYRFGKDKQVGYFDLRPIPGSHGTTFAVLSRNFARDNQHVYYAWSLADGLAPPGIRVIKTADPVSFTAVGMYYATDKNHAFYKDIPLQAADPASFKQWAESYIDYALDTTHVYFQDKLIAQADRGSFNVLADFYAQDKKTIFYKSKSLMGCNTGMFRVLESGYAKDDKRIYYVGEVLAGADPVSFALVSNEADRDAADKTHSYSKGLRIKIEKK